MKRVILSILSVSAILLLWYPSIANYVNNSMHDITIQEYSDKLKTINKEKMYIDAIKWNEDHSTYKYKDILNIQDGMMGYIEINGYNIRLPIYHYDNNNSLEKGVGHNKDTSLPIGGKSTHCVLAGHSGMTHEKMFDDLVRMKIGDVFKINVLNHICAYKVYDIQTVVPSKVNKYIKVQTNKDLCTLITCTPYGVNTHRLLVRGIRCDYNEEFTSQSFNRNDRTPLWVLLSVIADLIFFNILWNKLFRKKKDEENH